MCDKLMLHLGNVEFEKICVGADIEDALNLLSERMQLVPGNIIELTDGTECVVEANNLKSNTLRVNRPAMGDSYETHIVSFVVPYSVVVTTHCVGTVIDYEDFVRLEGRNILRRLIMEKRWKAANSLIDDLKSISVDISEFSNELSDIVAGAEKEENVEDFVGNLFSYIADSVRRTL